jgi:hypothetical protein
VVEHQQPSVVRWGRGRAQIFIFASNGRMAAVLAQQYVTVFVQLRIADVIKSWKKQRRTRQNLQRFYDSVRERAEGIDNFGRQTTHHH